MPNPKWKRLRGPEWDALPREEKLYVIGEIGKEDPEWAALPDEERQYVIGKLTGEEPGGVSLTGLAQSGLKGLAGGFGAAADFYRGLNEFPARMAMKGAEAAGLTEPGKLEKILDYTPMGLASRGLDWAEEKVAPEQDQGIAGSIVEAITSAPGYIAKYAPIVATGVGIPALIGITAGAETMSELGQDKPLTEALKGGATEGLMLGAFGGIGKAVRPIANAGLRAAAHMGATVGLGTGAGLIGGAPLEQSLGSGIGLALLAGHGELKTLKGIAAYREKLQAPRSQGGAGMDAQTAHDVAELQRLGKRDQAQAIIDKWNAEHGPQAPEARPVTPEVSGQPVEPPPQEGVPNAQEARTTAQAPSSQEGPQGGESGQVRVRNAPQVGVEAQAGEAKQPWQMSLSKYMDSRGRSGMDPRGVREALTAEHQRILEKQLIKDPASVPDEALQQHVFEVPSADRSGVIDSEWERRIAQKNARPSPTRGMPSTPGVAQPSTPQPTAQPTGEPIGPLQIKQFIRQNIVPVEVGHVRAERPLKMSALYTSLGELIRLKKWGDLDAMPHEIGHHLVTATMKNKFTAPNPVVEAEMESLGQSLYGKRRPLGTFAEEGFADFVRHWLQPKLRARLQSEAPATVSWFEKQLQTGGQFAEFGQALGELRKMYDTYEAQGAEGRVRAQYLHETPEIPEKSILTAMDRFRAAMVTAVRPFERLDIIQGIKDSPIGVSVGRTAQALRGKAAGLAVTAAEHGVYSPQTGEKLSDGLTQIFSRIAPEDVRDASEFAVANRALEIAKKGKAGGIEIPDAAQIVAERQERPGFREFSKGLNQFGHALTKWLVEMGGMTEEGATEILKSEFWVPLLRFNETKALGSQGGGAGRGFLGDATGIFRQKGSLRPVRNIAESMLVTAQRVFESGHRAYLGQTFLKALQRPDAEGRVRTGNIASEVLPDVTTETINLRHLLGMKSTQGVTKRLQKVIEVLQEAGIDIDTTEGREAFNYYVNRMAPKKGENIISITDAKGKTHLIQFHDEPFYQAIANLEPTQLPMWAEVMFAKPARLVKLGATGLNPSFSLITNLIRDTWESTMQTRGPAATVPFAAMKQLLPEFVARVKGTTSEGTIPWIKSGGPMATFFGMDRASTQLMAERVMMGTGGKARAVYAVKHPVDVLREVLSFSENINRANEYNRVYEMLRKQNKSHMEADMEAGLAAKEITVDFTRSGSIGQVINQVAAFYNPTIQGGSKALRELRTRPGTIMGRGIAGITIPGIALWLMNKDKKWHDNLPLWEKAMFMHFEVGDKIIRLPLPNNWGPMFYTPVIAMMEAKKKQNPKEFANITLEGLKGYIPDPFPSAVRPIIESTAPVPFSYFKRRPLVSDRLKGLSPEMQATQYTPAVYTAFAKALNSVYRAVTGAGPNDGISPLVLQNYAEGATGGLTRTLSGLTAPKKEAADIPVAGRLFTRTGGGGRSVDELYSQLEEARTVYASARQLQKEGKSQEAQAYIKKWGHLIGPSGERYRLLLKASETLAALRKTDATGEKLQEIASAYLLQANRGLRNVWTPEAAR